MKKLNRLLLVVVLLSFIAMLVSTYLTYMHFKPEASEFCNFGEQWNCDVVNKSKWSYVDLGFVEVPVSILGFGTYLVFFVVSILLIKGVDFRRVNKFFTQANVVRLLLLLSIAGVVFSLYLSYIEAFVLQTFCMFCVIQQVIILLLMGLFFVMGSMLKREKTR